ncbi:MAG: glycoside hydrolase family 2 TIM barrel-domain containing protein [Candidatus Omnitrophota bacterium]
MTDTKNKKLNKKIIVGILIAVLIALFGISAFILANLTKKGKTYISESTPGVAQLVVDGKPFIVRGVCYSPIQPGESHLYNWWGDSRKPWVIDGKLMQETGINTIRIYEPGGKPEQVKRVVSDLYDNFKIRTIMGHGLGFWDYPYTNYADPSVQHEIKKQVYQMVKAYKGECGILAWVLGNEANFSFDGRINPWSTPSIDQIQKPYDRKIARAKIYYTFINDLVKIVKKIDPSRPVGFGNGELGTIDVAKEFCPDADFVGIIIYRGKSFGPLFRQLKERFGKPCIMVEFGCDSYNAAEAKSDEENQSLFLKSLWDEVENNTFTGKGEANCLGGTIFEWNDEWWKYNTDDPNAWRTHNAEGSWSNGSYYHDIGVDGGFNMNEEWFGVVGFSDEKDGDGLYKRVPKRAYYTLKESWEKNK